MDQRQSVANYPDPSVENDSPFYANGGQQADVQASIADIRLANQLQQQMNPNMSQQHVEHEDPNTPPDTTGMGPGSAGNSEQKTSPKRRAKSARACDHCSSKKQGCVMDTDGVNCVRCNKAGIACTFRKQPGKRGPNPGYIKMLEARLAAVEDKTGRPHDLEPLTPNRKRSRNDYEEYARRQSSGAFDHPRDMYPQGYPRTMQAPMYGPHTYGQNDMPAGARWDPQAHPAQSATFEVPSDANAQPFKATWDEGTIEQYYAMIHSTFPILANTKDGIQDLLSKCRPEYAGVFFQALHHAVRSCTHPNEASQTKLIKATLFEMQALTLEKHPSIYHTLLLVQCWTLMTVQAENNHILASQGSILVNAIQLCHEARYFVGSGSEIGGAVDTEVAAGGRRLWLSLVIMDRLAAVGNARPSFIPYDSVELYPTDIMIVGEELYQVLRLTKALGHYSTVLIAPTNPQPSTAPLLANMLKTEVSLCWDSWPAPFADALAFPLLHCFYWVARMLTDLNDPQIDAQVLLNSAKHALSLLMARTDFYSPIIHYTFALAVLVLIELRNNARFKETVADQLREPLNKTHARDGWDKAIIDKVFEFFNTPAPDTLQQLAEAASGIADVKSGNGGEDGASTATGGSSVTTPSTGEFKKLREIVKKGYLSAF